MTGSNPYTKSAGRKYIVLLLALLLFHALNNFIIVSNDTTPLLWDGGDYFYKSLRYYDVLKNPGPGFLSDFNDISRYRPPFFMLSSFPLYLIFGRSPDVAVMTNLLYLIILVLSVYATGKRLHSEEAGILAALTTSVFPIIYGLSRSYWLDFSVTAMVALSVYLLVRTEYFNNRKYSLLFGVSVGLGMLTKWTYFVFLAGPFFYVFLLSLKKENQKTGRPVMNAVVSMLTAVVVCSFWYIPNGLNVANKLLGLSTGITGDEATRFQQLGETIGPSGIFNVKSLAFYAGKFINEQTTFILAAIFLFCAILLLIRDKKKTSWMLILWIVIPVIAFTLIKNKTARNTVPMLPAAGLIISMGIMSIRSSRARKAAVAIVLCAGLFQYAVTSYGCSFLPKRLALATPVGDVVLFEQPENHSYAIFRANKGDWKADEILETINSDLDGKKDIEIVLLPRDAFTWMAMEYSSHLKGFPFKFIGAINSPDSVQTADYVLVKKGGFVAPWFGMGNIYRSLDLMEKNMDNFVLIKSVLLPEERIFLPVYDIAETKHSRRSGIIFSESLQVIEYSATESLEGKNRRFTVESTVKAVKDIDGELMVLLRFVNKKMETVLKKAVKPETSLTELKKGQLKKLIVSLAVPPDTAEHVFSIEMGFYSREGDKALSYRPEYLIYKRLAADNTT